MTVASALNRKEYAGDAVTTSFATNPVEFFDSDELDVYLVVTATGVATLQTITTHYTVSGGAGSTGTVTMLTAPSSLQTLVIVRTLDILQETDLVNNDESDAEVIEDAFDRGTMILQQIDAKVDRSFRLADSDVSGASLVVPTPAASKLIGWSGDGLSLQLYASADLGAVVPSAFMETLLDDGTAAVARATLDAQEDVITTAGDIVVGGATAVAARKAIGTEGYRLTAQLGATDKLQYLPPEMGMPILNGYLAYSVAANALTIALKGWDGNDPSATNPVYVLIRSATAATGLPELMKVTAATSLVISSGSTLGFVSATAGRLWVVGFNDAGTFRLGAINCLSGTAPSLSVYPLAGWGIASSTAEGGAGAADSAAVFYTGAAITSKGYQVLGYATWESGLATAGTWDAAPTRAQLFGPGMPLPGQEVQAQRTQTGAVATGTTTMPIDDTIPQITEGVELLTRTITPSSAANLLRVNGQVNLGHSAAGPRFGLALFDGAASAVATSQATPTAANDGFNMALCHSARALVTTAITFSLRGGSATAGTVTFNGFNAGRVFGGAMASFLACVELMA